MLPDLRPDSNCANEKTAISIVPAYDQCRHGDDAEATREEAREQPVLLEYYYIGGADLLRDRRRRAELLRTTGDTPPDDR